MNQQEFIKRAKSFEKEKKEELDKIKKNLDEFLKKFDFKEHPEKIDELKKEDIYNPKAEKRDYFLYWIEHKLENLASLKVGSAKYAENAIANIDEFKKLLKMVVDNTITIEEKIKANWAEIKKWGRDKHIAKKIIFCYNSDKLIPILSTNLLKEYVDRLDLDYKKISIDKFNNNYSDLSREEKYLLLNEILMPYKISLPEIKDWDNITFAKFLEYVFPDVNERKKNNEKTINKNKENQEHTNMYNYKKIIENHKQMIFYGPPGTGKTREAKRIAYQLIYPNKSVPEKEEDLDNELEKSKQFKIVVFHPSYEYDDFMIGIKPVIKGKHLNFEEKHGIFYELCEKARKKENNQKKFVLIIDEINRGNLPKILGELVYALEYRESTIKLPVTGEDFQIPENVYIIGTMNSADRSIGHIDVAIRRRFALVYMGPNSGVVKETWKNIDETYGNDLASFMDNLNKKLQEMAKNSGIVVDEREIGIGHSYFLPVQEKHKGDPKEYINQKWKYFVLPLLKEYAVQFGIGNLKDILECEDINYAMEKLGIIENKKHGNESANSGDQSKSAKQ